MSDKTNCLTKQIEQPSSSCMHAPQLLNLGETQQQPQVWVCTDAEKLAEISQLPKRHQVEYEKAVFWSIQMQTVSLIIPASFVDMFTKSMVHLSAAPLHNVELVWIRYLRFAVPASYYNSCAHTNRYQNGMVCFPSQPTRREYKQGCFLAPNLALLALSKDFIRIDFGYESQILPGLVHTCVWFEIGSQTWKSRKWEKRSQEPDEIRSRQSEYRPVVRCICSKRFLLFRSRGVEHKRLLRELDKSITDWSTQSLCQDWHNMHEIARGQVRKSDL